MGSWIAVSMVGLDIIPSSTAQRMSPVLCEVLQALHWFAKHTGLLSQAVSLVY